jgi:hypothetical protein
MRKQLVVYYKYKHHYRGIPMSPDIWYELRVAGSAGTRDGIAKGTAEGIAISESGRLCSIASGQAKRFASEQDAMSYLLNMTIPGNYRFEVVNCRGRQSTPGSAPPNFVTTSSTGNGRLNR